MNNEKINNSLDTISSELDYIDETLIKKYRSNEEHIKFLNSILDSSISNFNIIIRNLDNLDNLDNHNK